MKNDFVKNMIDSKPIGRIEYLGSNGAVGEVREYTSPEYAIWEESRGKSK